MPPKKEKKDTSKENATKEEDRDIDRDSVLKEELTRLETEYEEIKKKVNELKNDNEWLETEANRITEESQEYMTFMSKKAASRQNAIITLSDHNKQEIEDLKKQKEELIKDFESKKLALQTNLITKQNLLNGVRAEIEEMAEYKELKQNQLDEIKNLEKEITSVRNEQTRMVAELRTDFLKEKADQKKEADYKIATIIKVANREAKSCLSENTAKIKSENANLRGELFELIRQTKLMTENKNKLEEQKLDLLNEIRYAEDLKKIRSTQQKRVIEKLFPNLDS